MSFYGAVATVNEKDLLAALPAVWNYVLPIKHGLLGLSFPPQRRFDLLNQGHTTLEAFTDLKEHC